jgi:alginate O-acetyltransferase complex protein AlgI
LFDAPWRASTAAGFWRDRWNRGFAEMTAIAVQRPLARRFGDRRALLASFAWSGVLHEVALSLPVRAGFGLPTLYFVVQGLFVLWQGERRSRAATLAAIVLPLPLVFHPWFLAGVLGASA